jgi:hypothetical protein
MTKQTKSRNPVGLETKKPIALRLTPNERAEAVRLSEKLHVSMSLLAHRAYLAGLPELKAEVPDSSTKPRNK